MASRWRIYRKLIIASLKTTENIVKATIVLHNLLMHATNQYCPSNFADTEVNGNIIEGQWRSEDTQNLSRTVHSGSNFFLGMQMKLEDHWQHIL